MIRNYVLDNPVVRREARLRFWRHWPTVVKLVACAAAAVAFAIPAVLWGWGAGVAARKYFAGPSWGQTYYVSSPAMPDYAPFIMIYAMALAAVAALAGARSISSEREVGTWEQVLITRLRPAHVVIGKIAGAIWPAMVILVITTPAVLAYMLASLAAYTPLTHADAGLLDAFFSPAGYSATPFDPRPIGGFWILTGAALWLAQGGTIGVFSSLRYRSSVTSLAVALLWLAIAAGLNAVFLTMGGMVGGRRPEAASAVEQIVVSVGVAWVWPLLAAAVPLWLALYEFRDFDVWLQQRQAQAGS